MENYMKLEVPAKSCNESFVRAAVAAFSVQLDLSVEEMSDIKTAVSEAVTNSIVHGYANMKGVVKIVCKVIDSVFEIEVTDFGVGIEDIGQAMQPLYTSRPDYERSGMGFTVMQTFMDELYVESGPGEGTTVRMRKRIGG
ncbi:MAG: anti-sigma F factor [Ruminococcaceae bacterium]|nr:anti-sigma F factor [Oscillospiraceae bacterium]